MNTFHYTIQWRIAHSSPPLHACYNTSYMRCKYYTVSVGHETVELWFK